MSVIGKEAVIGLPAAAPLAIRRHGRRSWKARFPEQLQGLIVPTILVVLWELLSRMGVFPPNWLPAPTVVAQTIYELTAEGELLKHLGITLWRITSGFAIGAAAGTLLGGVTGYSPLCRRLLDPLLQSLRSIPSMAWVPLFLLWLGIQEASKISLIALGAFFPVYLNLLSGILSVDRKLIEVGQVYRLSGFQLVRRVILPAALPCYIVGLRSGLGLSWMFVVAAEIMGASRGLGFLMIDGQMTGRASIIIASVLLFAIFGKVTDLTVERIGRRFLRHRCHHQRP